jgi:hypothetical protein
MALPLTQALRLSAEFFAAEPAAVSAVYEVQLDPSAPVEFAAIRRHPEAGSVLVAVARTEEAAQAALERASVAGDPIRTPVAVIGRELVLETTMGPALVRVGGPASVGWNSASYPCEVLAPAAMAGSVWTAPAADVYAAAEAADREAAAAASPVSR